jgi:hypothetical protein
MREIEYVIIHVMEKKPSLPVAKRTGVGNNIKYAVFSSAGTRVICR